MPHPALNLVSETRSNAAMPARTKGPTFLVYLATLTFYLVCPSSDDAAYIMAICQRQGHKDHFTWLVGHFTVIEMRSAFPSGDIFDYVYENTDEDDIMSSEKHGFLQGNATIAR